MELTVLGCSGSYGAPAGGACSGYIVRAGDAVLWMDCGNGTFTNLQQHIRPERTHGRRHHAQPPGPLRRHLRPARAEQVRHRPQVPPGLRARRSREAARMPRRRLGRHLRLEPRRRRRRDVDRRRRPAVLAHRPSAAHGCGRDRARRQASRLHGRHRTGMELRGVRSRRRPGALGGDLPTRRHPSADPSLRPPGRRSGARGAGAPPRCSLTCGPPSTR